jgi:hypothetical protein
MMRETPIKAVHIWGSVAVIVVTLVVGILKVGQWSGSAEEQLKSINTAVSALSWDLKTVAAQAQETRDRVIRLETIVAPPERGTAHTQPRMSGTEKGRMFDK